jgi:hypothetical protein
LGFRAARADAPFAEATFGAFAPAGFAAVLRIGAAVLRAGAAVLRAGAAVFARANEVFARAGVALGRAALAAGALAKGLPVGLIEPELRLTAFLGMGALLSKCNPPVIPDFAAIR